MRKNIVLIVITLISGRLVSQNPSKNLNQASWQQHVDYRIAVSLNDKTHRLSGYETIKYTNNSPNSLNEIYMHLWPNGYRTRTTAFATQHLENGKSDFYFAPPEDRGWIDSLNFTINGSTVKWDLTKDIDIAKLTLNKPIAPGESVEIATPFMVKIPGIFSRMGQDDGLYCITQWYPKPAVYDVNGWNPIPYLDQGEFYSEFGSFDVSITLPKDYVCAATGLVQSEEEKAWWLSRTTDAGVSHPSSQSEKTLRFLQDSVHDFAWFCSKEFKVAHSQVVLGNGKTVDTWLFSKSKNKDGKLKGVEYIDEAVKFYSDKVGNYPYALAQVVITPLKAGGGMEYPTITNCQSIDKTTIVHEVGHNWFYGILGSNERDYPWMDESFNTYYEGRNKLETEAKKEMKTSADKKGFSINFGDFDQSRLLFGYSCRKNNDQPGNLISTEYTDNNYGAIIYAKNPLSIAYLQHYLGDEMFDGMMHAYFEKWKFKHPLPNDFKDHAVKYTGKDLAWFFNGALGSTQKEDYKLSHKKGDDLIIKNKGTLVAPLAITRRTRRELKEVHWVEGFSGEKSIDIASLGYTDSTAGRAHTYVIDEGAGKNNYKIIGQQDGSLKIMNTGKQAEKFAITRVIYDDRKETRYNDGFSGVKTFNVNNLGYSHLTSGNTEYRVDGEDQTIDLYPQNNGKSPVKFQLLANVEKPDLRQVFWSPVYAYNVYNRSMLGLGFYNSIFPQKKNEFVLMPVYSFHTADVNGYAQYWHNFYPKGSVRNIQVGFKSARFASLGNIYESRNTTYQSYIDASSSKNYYTGITYEKFAPFIQLDFKPRKLRSERTHTILLRYVMINEQERGAGYLHNFGSAYVGTANVNYQFKDPNVLYPRSFGVDYQYGVQNNVINRVGAEFKQAILIKQRRKSIEIRLFAGTFIGTPATGNARANDYLGRALFQAGGTTGTNDYLYDQALIGREEPFRQSTPASADIHPFWGHQVLVRDAGFRNFVSVGSSDKWMTGLNLTIPFPIPVPIGIYADASYGAIRSQSAATGAVTYSNNLNYTGGLYVQLVKDVAYWYVPLFQNAEVEAAWNVNKMDNVFKRSSFVFNLNKINPIALVRNFKF